MIPMHLHYLYPLPPLEHLSSPSRSINISKELRGTLFERSLRPQIAWDKMRLWPEEGPHKPTKVEQKIESDIQRKLYQEQANRERAAAKERCNRMTIQEAWEILQCYLHTNEYDIEGMSDADWDVYFHAKSLINSYISRSH